MQKNQTVIERLRSTSHLFVGNASFVEALYGEYLENPASVPFEWRTFFESLGDPPANTHPAANAQLPGESGKSKGKRISTPVPSPSIVSQKGNGIPGTIPAEKQSGVRQLILAYRNLGHMAATLDPIQLRKPMPIVALQLSEHGLTKDDLDTMFDTGNIWGPKDATLHEIIRVLQKTYTRNIGVEYFHINDLEQRTWLRERLERTQASSSFSPKFKRQLLERITAAEGIERFLHTRYVGQKRFSLEGGESLIPLLDTIINQAGATSAKELVIGMAHRGRLNVLVNIMGKTPQELFKEFEGHYDDTEGSGDVKYHEGFSSNANTSGGPVHLALAFNPSHLEIIDPVVEGSVRARQDRRGDHGRREVMAILIHGDAAIAGQGVVYETFNLAQTRGFTTGGTIHIVVNNQIGFTLSHPLDSRSTLYCTDIGKVVQAPILHVNGDDPEATVYAAQLAVDYRMKFNKDVVIDLVCYRRHGHNEADEPSATQPMMYEKIENHPTTLEIYTKRLIEEQVVTREQTDALVREYREKMEADECIALSINPDISYPFIANWSAFLDQSWTAPAHTRIGQDTLARLGKLLTAVPEDFTLNPRVRKIVDERCKMINGTLHLDWGCAETLAYASLLDEGYRVRLTGQDSGRGTFFHRHAVLHCQRTGASYIPLRAFGQGPDWFTMVDSILSEEAVLGFEYGYSTTVPNALVVWEAQFGDFANGAQVVIDQFLASSEQKWRRLSGLVLMLPHGWEGQGPEHTSARLERFLQLCAEENIQVAYPTTPAQMFHLLRREMVRPYRKPLIIMSPKSTLRRKRSFSTLEDLTQQDFQLAIGETKDMEVEKIQRIILCTGKVYYDLLDERERTSNQKVAILRIEQLYPFPSDRLAEILEPFRHVQDVVWCQEEPRNQGAWYSIQHDIRRRLFPGQQLRYVGRMPHAAPAGGILQKHLERQKKLVSEALSMKTTAAVLIDAQASISPES